MDWCTDLRLPTSRPTTTTTNLSLPSEAVLELYRTFLARLSLPRLVHFLDLVLPQMHPHQQVRDRDDIRQLTSHYLSLHGQDGSGCCPPVQMNFLFHSHAGLVHILVEWYRHPLLVFSDYPKVVGVQLEVLRSATTLEIYRQHVAFGIRAGQSTLFAFEAQGTRYIMVGILIASNVPQSGSQENRQWKHVAPHQTELFFLLYAAWVRSRAERPSVSYTKVVSKVARTGHNLHYKDELNNKIAAATNSYTGGTGRWNGC